MSECQSFVVQHYYRVLVARELHLLVHNTQLHRPTKATIEISAIHLLHLSVGDQPLLLPLLPAVLRVALPRPEERPEKLPRL